MSPPPPKQPDPATCPAHAGLTTSISDLKGTADGIQTTLTELRVQLAGDLGRYEESIKGAWKEIRELREDVRNEARRDRGDEPTGVREARDREDNQRRLTRDREDDSRTSLSPPGGVFKIPVPKVIVWLAIAVGLAIAAGGWAWGVFNESRAAAAEQRATIESRLAAPAARTSARTP
jgi:hypothetical protein